MHTVDTPYKQRQRCSYGLFAERGKRLNDDNRSNLTLGIGLVIPPYRYQQTLSWCVPVCSLGTSLCMYKTPARKRSHCCERSAQLISVSHVHNIHVLGAMLGE